LNSNSINDMLNLSKAVTADIDVPRPEGLEYMPFQKAGVAYAANTKACLFADPMGLGKTIQSIGTMNYLGLNRGIVACPASLCFNWEKELLKWHVAKPKVAVLTKALKDFNGVDFLIVSYALLSKVEWLKRIAEFGKVDIVVLDECHYLKNPKAKRTKHVLANNGLRSFATRVHCISGTPIVNRPIEIYPVVKALRPETIDNFTYFQYAIKFCGAYKGPFGWNFNGATNLKELGRRLRSNFMVQRKKEEVLSDLPDKTITMAYLPTGKGENKLIQAYANFNEDELFGKRTAKVKFEELSKHRRELGIAKIPASIDYIKTQLECGHEKILVFAHHTEVLKGLKEGLKEFGVVEIRGATPGAERQRAVELFQGNKGTKVFLGSITAAGVGLTLTAGSYVIFVEPSYVPGENFQAMDRAHRIGQKNHVLVEFLVQPGSLDERVLKKVLEKQKNIDGVME
jgi:SWI/SNF-related matrix-associated actin-dependent regulator 1 of chromatin subfamily A